MRPLGTRIRCLRLTDDLMDSNHTPKTPKIKCNPIAYIGIVTCLLLKRNTRCLLHIASRLTFPSLQASQLMKIGFYQAVILPEKVLLPPWFPDGSSS